jgi:ABC-2 type transport system permease protein
MQALAKLTRLEAKVLFLRDPVATAGRARRAHRHPAGVRRARLRPLPAPELGGQRPIDTVLPSIALAISVGVLAIYREKGILRRLSTTPASPALLLGAQVTVNLAMAVAALVLVLAIGAAWLGMAMPASPGWFVVAFLLGTVALFAVGMLAFFPSLFLAGPGCPSTRCPSRSAASAT